jgi:hypothetical protein
MSDISKCNGVGNEGKICPKREKCYRYTSEGDKFWQSWIEAPYTIDLSNEYLEDGFFCPMFWGMGAQQIFEQLQRITKGEEK